MTHRAPPVREDRVLIYSHDTYGLGHLRRCTAIAERLLRDRPHRSVLLVTGSPRAQAFDLPPGLDVVKLPSVLKRSDGSYDSRSLRTEIGATAALRAELLRAAAVGFRPHAVLVDHSPTGFMGELEPMFDVLTSGDVVPRPRFVLGLRDVIDDAEAVRVQWTREGAWRRLDGLYDKVLVYGDPSVRSTAEDLDLAARLGDRLEYTGYVARPATPPSRDTAPPLILVTTGGGGDGQDLLRAYARYLETLEDPTAFRSLVVTGPFLSGDRAAEIRARFARTAAAVEVVEFVDDFPTLLGRASGLVAMAGYNTTVEALASGVPTLLVPRERPRREQAIRAERLARILPQFRVHTKETATPEAIGRFVADALIAPPSPPCRLRMDGADRAAAAIETAIAASSTEEQGLAVPTMNRTAPVARSAASLGTPRSAFAPTEARSAARRQA